MWRNITVMSHFSPKSSYWTSLYLSGKFPETTLYHALHGSLISQLSFDVIRVVSVNSVWEVILIILTTVFSERLAQQRLLLLTSKYTQSRLICSHGGWAEAPPCLSLWYKALSPSLYLRPKFRRVCVGACVWGELSESFTPRGKKTTTRRTSAFIYWGVFLLRSHNPWFSSTFFFL